MENSWDGTERRKFPVEQECKHENKIVEMHTAIYGNGDPSHGLLWIAKENARMIKSNTEFIEFIKKHFVKILVFCGIGISAAVFNLIIEIIKSHVTIHY